MTRYRRLYQPGGTYFFTVVTHKRRPVFNSAEARDILRQAFDVVREKRPFDILAMCLLPDHLHCVWSMPEGDSDFSKRWSAVKGTFSRSYAKHHRNGVASSASRRRKGESSFWQRRFWEHAVRSEDELARVFDYIHYNPVKHGLVTHPDDWLWSSIHRFLKERLYAQGWGGDVSEWMTDLPFAGE